MPDLHFSYAESLRPECPLSCLSALGLALVAPGVTVVIASCRPRALWIEIRGLANASDDDLGEAVERMRATSLKHIDYTPWDLLRGLGQQPRLSDRVHALIQAVTPEDLLLVCEPRSALLTSLRLELQHPSDVPPAYRYDTAPRPRYSHPTRNALAAVALSRLLEGSTNPAGAITDLEWIAPLIPIGGESWRTAWLAPETWPDLVLSGLFCRSRVAVRRHGRMWALAGHPVTEWPPTWMTDT